MKHFFFKHILRAKYMVNGRYFWSKTRAFLYAQSLSGTQVVRTTSWRKVARFRNSPDYSTHPDANNYNTNI